MPCMISFSQLVHWSGENLVEHMTVRLHDHDVFDNARLGWESQSYHFAHTRSTSMSYHLYVQISLFSAH
jgi:hypothetical protein